MDIDYKKQALESFNTIQTNIGFLGIDREMKRIMVTSSIKGEGKSTISSNIANSYAFSKKKVLLIDCDMRNPSVHRVLDLPNRNGLADFIMAAKDTQNPEDYLIHYNSHLDILTAGHRPPNPTELLASGRMGFLLEAFDQEYEYIILDTPPVLIVPDAVALHKYVDGVLLVVRHGYTTKEVLEDCKKAWEVAGTKPDACILNAIPDMQKRYSYYGYYDYMEDPKAKKGKRSKTAGLVSSAKSVEKQSAKYAEHLSAKSEKASEAPRSRYDKYKQIPVEELAKNSNARVSEKVERDIPSFHTEQKPMARRKLK